MQCYFNEDLLYQFIYRYYPFADINQTLVISGELMVAAIVKTIIMEDQNLSFLTNHPIKNVTDLVCGQFCYKLAGINQFYAAFGNFFFNLLSTGLHSLRPYTYDSLTTKIQDELKSNPNMLQQIKNIQHPFRDRLKEMAYIQSNTNSLPQLDLNQIQYKKINFLRSFINFEQTVPKPKKKKDSKKPITQLSKSMAQKDPNRSSFSSNKIQEQRNTQVDEFESQLLLQNQNLFPQKICNFNRNIQTNHKKIKSSLNITNIQLKNELILAYDDLLPQKL